MLFVVASRRLPLPTCLMLDACTFSSRVSGVGRSHRLCYVVIMCPSHLTVIKGEPNGTLSFLGRFKMMSGYLLNVHVLFSN